MEERELAPEIVLLAVLEEDEEVGDLAGSSGQSRVSGINERGDRAEEGPIMEEVLQKLAVTLMSVHLWNGRRKGSPDYLRSI